MLGHIMFQDFLQRVFYCDVFEIYIVFDVRDPSVFSPGVVEDWQHGPRFVQTF